MERLRRHLHLPAGGLLTQKLLLLSILFAVIFIPAFAARDSSPRRGFKRALFFFLAFCIAYVVALKYAYFRL